jgi:hypothetical protein
MRPRATDRSTPATASNPPKLFANPDASKTPDIDCFATGRLCFLAFEWSGGAAVLKRSFRNFSADKFIARLATTSS